MTKIFKLSSLKNPDFESAELKLISAATLKADAPNVYTYQVIHLSLNGTVRTEVHKLC